MFARAGATLTRRRSYSRSGETLRAVHSTPTTGCSPQLAPLHPPAPIHFEEQLREAGIFAEAIQRIGWWIPEI